MVCGGKLIYNCQACLDCLFYVAGFTYAPAYDGRHTDAWNLGKPDAPGPGRSLAGVARIRFGLDDSRANPDPECPSQNGPKIMFFLIAKSVHVAAYASLAILSGWVPIQARWRWLFLIFMAMHAFGTEWLQHEMAVGPTAALLMWPWTMPAS